MGFGIIYDGFWLLLCSSICRCESRMVRNEITVNGNNMQITVVISEKMILHTVFIDNTNIYEQICQEADAEKLGVRRRNKSNSGELGGMRGSIRPPGVNKNTFF